MHMYSNKGMETICENFYVDHGVRCLLTRKKKILDSLLTDTISGSGEIGIVVKCILSVISFIVNTYQEYSSRFIIVVIIY